MRSHPVAPVLVMTDAEEQLVVANEIEVSMNINIGTVINHVAVGLEPLDKTCVPVRKCLAGRPVLWRYWVVWVGKRYSVGLLGKGPPWGSRPGGGGWAGEKK